MKRRLLLPIIPLLAFAACNVEEIDNNIYDNESDGVVAIIPSINDSELTKSAVSVSDADKLSFTWSSDDVLGIVPLDGKTPQTSYKVTAGGSTSATFDGGSWAVKKDSVYAAYLPYQEVNNNSVINSSKKVGISMLGQKQVGNGNTDHLGAYDVMYAKGTASGDGKVNFEMDRKISFIRILMNVPAGTYESLQLWSDYEAGAWFYIGGDLDLNDGSFTPIGMTPVLNIDLEGISFNEPGQLKVWMALIPSDFSAGPITAVANATDGTVVKAMAKPSKPWVANTTYKPSFQNASTTGALPAGLTFRGQMITAAVSAENIREIVFKTGQKTSTATAIDMAFEAGTLTVSTSADKFTLNENSSFLFGGLSNLQTIEGLDKLDTQSVTNMTQMFGGCSSLTALDLSGFDFSNVASAYAMFGDCSSLRNLDLSSWHVGPGSTVQLDGICVRTGSSGFTTNIKCSETLWVKIMNAVKADGGDTSNFQLINQNIDDYGLIYEGSPQFRYTLAGMLGKSDEDSDAFSGLTEIDFAICQPANTLTGTVFSYPAETDTGVYGELVDNGDGTKKLILRTRAMKFKISDVSGMFSIMKDLEIIQGILDLDMSDCRNFSQMFYNCSKLEYIGEMSTSGKAIYMNSMFEGCSKLPLIDLSHFQTDGVSDMSSMFDKCIALQTIDLTSFNTRKAGSVNMNRMFAACSDLSRIIMGKDFIINDSNVLTNMISRTGQSLGHCDFYCYGGQWRAITDGTRYTGYNDQYHKLMSPVSQLPSGSAFHTFISDVCSNSRPVLSTEDISRIVFHVQTLPELSGLRIQNTDIWAGMSDGTLHFYTTADKFVMPVDASEYFYNNLSNLEEIIGLENLDVSQTINFGQMFYGCEKLHHLDLSSWEVYAGFGRSESSDTNFYGMFWGCTSLETLDISSFTTDKQAMICMNSMFADCTNLSSIKLNPGFHLSEYAATPAYTNTCVGYMFKNLGINVDRTKNTYNTVFYGISRKQFDDEIVQFLPADYDYTSIGQDEPWIASGNDNGQKILD